MKRDRDLLWWLRIVVPAVGVAALVAAYTVGSGGAGARPNETGSTTTDGTVGAQGITLVSYNTCETALRELRDAALPLVGPYGFGGAFAITDATGGSVPIVPAAPGAAAGAPKQTAPEQNAAPAEGRSAAGPQDQQAPGHSTTNTHEAGVDEPDLAKTDGRRVVTVADGRLRITDVAQRKQVATLDIPGGTPTQLLLNGDRALVMTNEARMMVPQKPTPMPMNEPAGAQLVLVDLAAPKVIGSLSVDGNYVDARQIGSVARVVVRTGPHLNFVYPDGVRSPNEATFRNQEIVRSSPISDWLPHYDLQSEGKSSSGQLVECSAVSHPASYTGTGMLTVLTFDLTKELGTGDPVSIVADGDTVYGTEKSLYVADDHYPRMVTGFAPTKRGSPLPTQRTEIYQFDISGPGKPTYVASGGVDGTLLNQYSLSEYNGHLRIATTSQQNGPCCDQPGKSESLITVLTRKGEELTEVGKVRGLGVGERIYAVRFFGPTGYVVTFRQTDPLYTVDLSNPAAPKVVGELKITGYSAYLHPLGNGRLIGVGQEATEQGRRLGTQISLFDTGNLTAVRRLAQHQLAGGTSEVEFDPHAFLYWPEKNLLVVPVMQPYQGETRLPPVSGALVLRLSGDALTEVGTVTNAIAGSPYGDTAIRRAMVIGDELWTISGSGIKVSDLDKLGQRAWIPFS
jgi:uncharacterized secreted protein with C-terminal beta-propeller domain